MKRRRFLSALGCVLLPVLVLLGWLLWPDPFYQPEPGIIKVRYVWPRRLNPLGRELVEGVPFDPSKCEGVEIVLSQFDGRLISLAGKGRDLVPGLMQAREASLIQAVIGRDWQVSWRGPGRSRSTEFGLDYDPVGVHHLHGEVARLPEAGYHGIFSWVWVPQERQVQLIAEDGEVWVEEGGGRTHLYLSGLRYREVGLLSDRELGAAKEHWAEKVREGDPVAFVRCLWTEDETLLRGIAADAARLDTDLKLPGAVQSVLLKLGSAAGPLLSMGFSDRWVGGGDPSEVRPVLDRAAHDHGLAGLHSRFVRNPGSYRALLVLAGDELARLWGRQRVLRYAAELLDDSEQLGDRIWVAHLSVPYEYRASSKDGQAFVTAHMAGEPSLEISAQRAAEVDADGRIRAYRPRICDRVLYLMLRLLGEDYSGSLPAPLPAAWYPNFPSVHWPAPTWLQTGTWPRLIEEMQAFVASHALEALPARGWIGVRVGGTPALDEHGMYRATVEIFREGVLLESQKIWGIPQSQQREHAIKTFGPWPLGRYRLVVTDAAHRFETEVELDEDRELVIEALLGE